MLNISHDKMNGVLFIAMWLFINGVHAAVYKWVDENGVTHFSQTPPANYSPQKQSVTKLKNKSTNSNRHRSFCAQKIAPFWDEAEKLAFFLKGNCLMRVKRLLQSGVNPSQVVDSHTPLTFAVSRKNIKLVKVLLRYNADVDQANTIFANTPLIIAAKNTDSHIMDLLIEAGADISKANELGKTPLIVASATGNILAVKKLLAKGADPYKKDIHGRNAIMYAEKNGHFKISEILQNN